MYSVHGRLPVAFNEIWTSKRDGNPNLNLRNADSLYSMCQLTNTLTWPCTVYVVSLTSRPLLARVIACNMHPVNSLQYASKNSFANCVQLEEK